MGKATNQPQQPRQSVNDELVARIKLAAQGISQAELARKTGFTQQDVNRYMRGGRVPLTFAHALVKALDVNPTWLLTGEGAARISEVSATTASTASNLMELVNAMSTVMKMKLGSLAGKQREKALYELNQRLEEYEAIRGRLDEQVRPFFKGLLDDISALFARQNFKAAELPIRAAIQASRLCHDEQLHARLDFFHAGVLHAKREFQQERQVARRGFFRYFTTTPDVGHLDLYRVRGYIISLSSQAHLNEASRTCRAAGLLFENMAGKPEYSLLTHMEGTFDVHLGRLKEGVGKIMVSYASLHPSLRDLIKFPHVEVSLLAGTMTLEDVLDEDASKLERLSATLRKYQAQVVTRFAALERPAEFRKVWDFYTARLPGRDGVEDDDSFPRALLAALDGNREAYKTFVADSARAQPVSETLPAGNMALSHRMRCCYIARLCGNRVAAHKELLLADSLLIGLDPEITPPILTVAVHYRNAYTLAGKAKRDPVPPGLLQRGAEFFERHVAAGYHIFTNDSREARAVLDKR